MISAFRFLSAATEPGSKINEDAYGLWPARDTARAAWVLDGVTGINDRALLPGPSDAAWFVAQVQEALPALLAQAPAMPIADLVSALAAELERRQSAAWVDARGADGRETPAASFALIRLLGDEIEIARLGDCLVLLESTDGAVKALEHPVLEQIEAETRRAILELRAADVTDPQAILHADDAAVARAAAATELCEDGYGVLAGEQSCVPMIHVDRLPARSLRRVLLASDGYYRLVDHYHARNDVELVRDTERNGADALLKQLRAIESEDPLGVAYPRLKMRDDATALLLGVGDNGR